MKRIILCVLCLLMVFSLASCGGETNDSSADVVIETYEVNKTTASVSSEKSSNWNVSVESSATEPVEVSAEKPIEEPVEVPVEKPAEEPVKIPEEKPAEESVEVPVEKPVMSVQKPTYSKQDSDEESTPAIYITKTGKRYHYDSTCGNGEYFPSTLSDAKNRGLTPCKKCVE
ncbi:MAG: hypothetical protein IKU72_01295 [Oscillospiraceae bacterium]|nr:hypothetical protein [Oscillospiraceae bacterium]